MRNLLVALATLVLAAQTAAASPARWGIGDGKIMNAHEQRVFDRLDAALKPTPTSSPRIENWISDFHVDEPASSPGVWRFSGVRLIAQASYVPRVAATETYFTGSFEPATGKVTLFRESTLGP
jgi:hypothetical protein